LNGAGLQRSSHGRRQRARFGRTATATTWRGPARVPKPIGARQQHTFAMGAHVTGLADDGIE
jgi:hypothetical protein